MPTEKDRELLKDAFSDFIRTSQELQKSYEKLKEQSQRVSLYLANVLENIHSAVMVFSADFQLTLWNRHCESYFPVLRGKTPPLSFSELSSQAEIDLLPILQFEKNSAEITLPSPQGDKWLEISHSDFIDHQERSSGHIILITDRTDFKALQQKSQQEERLLAMGKVAAEVAHEIRNPLASIELMVALLEEETENLEKRSELFMRIKNAVAHMNYSVTNILCYTRNIQPEKTRFRLSEIVDQAEQITIDLVGKKNIILKKQIPEIEILADFALLKQSLANILINAAQAVEQNGQIEISACQEETKVKIRIGDNGHGIPEAVQPRIFEPFFTTKHTGTGLGLAMAKRIVSSHGGQISFVSGQQGTLFLIEIPLE